MGANAVKWQTDCGGVAFVVFVFVFGDNAGDEMDEPLWQTVGDDAPCLPERSEENSTEVSHQHLLRRGWDINTITYPTSEQNRKNNNEEN